MSQASLVFGDLIFISLRENRPRVAWNNVDVWCLLYPTIFLGQGGTWIKVLGEHQVVGMDRRLVDIKVLSYIRDAVG